jgi:hypothetical protein
LAADRRMHHRSINGGMLLKWTAATATCHKKSATVGAAVQHPYVAEKPTTCACASLLVYAQSRNIRSRRVQIQETTVTGNDFYTPHFTLSNNSSPTHQPHSILSYPFMTLYFGTKFEPSRTLYFGSEGVRNSTNSAGRKKMWQN